MRKVRKKPGVFTAALSPAGHWVLEDERGGVVVDMPAKRRGGHFIFGLPVKVFDSRAAALDWGASNGYDCL